MKRQAEVDGSHPVPQRNCAQKADGLAAGYGTQSGQPLVFRQCDEGADDGVRVVEIASDHVVLRRRVAGIPMRLVVRMSAFAGIALRLTGEDGEGVALVLAHADPSLEVTLYCAPDTSDVVAEWRGFARRFGLPMLVTRLDGRTGPAYPMIGRLVVGDPVPRRRRRSGLKQRRPSIFRRRAAGRPVTANVTGTVEPPPNKQRPA